MSGLVKTDRDGRVLTIVITRAEKKNALTHEMHAASAAA